MLIPSGGYLFGASQFDDTNNSMNVFDRLGFVKPSNQLHLASDGFIDGAALEGGCANRGGIFRLSSSGDYTELHEFGDDADGYSVFSPLVEGGDGRIYGFAFDS